MYHNFWGVALAAALRPLALGLTALEPDSTLHQAFVESGDGGPRLSDEGVRLLRELADVARTKLAMLTELEFRSDSAPPECANNLASTRQAVTQLAWMLWAIEGALSKEGPRSAPGRITEAIDECARIASLAYCKPITPDDPDQSVGRPLFQSSPLESESST